MNFLKETIVDLKAKYLTHGIKVRRLDEETGSAEDELKDAKQRVINAKKDMANPTANWQTQAKLDQAHNELTKLKLRIKRDAGDVKSVSIIVPEDKSSAIHSELHGMWKKRGIDSTPWQSVHGEKEGTVKVRFDDYRPGTTIRNVSIEDLIAHVKKYEINEGIEFDNQSVKELGDVLKQLGFIGGTQALIKKSIGSDSGKELKKLAAKVAYLVDNINHLS